MKVLACYMDASNLSHKNVIWAYGIHVTLYTWLKVDSFQVDVAEIITGL